MSISIEEKDGKNCKFPVPSKDLQFIVVVFKGGLLLHKFGFKVGEKEQDQ